MPADSGLQSILITAIVGALAAYLNQLWKYSKDAYLARVDETCSLVFQLADRAAEYWLIAKPDLPRKVGKVSERRDIISRREQLVLSETEIFGHLQQLQFLRVILQHRFGLSDQNELIDLMATFEGQLTGGDFAARSRAPDLERAKLTYKAASDLVAHLRAGADRGNRLWRIIFTKLEHLLPYRRPTTAAGRIEEGIWLAAFMVFFISGCCLLLIALWQAI